MAPTGAVNATACWRVRRMQHALNCGGEVAQQQWLRHDGGDAGSSGAVEIRRTREMQQQNRRGRESLAGIGCPLDSTVFRQRLPTPRPAIIYFEINPAGWFGGAGLPRGVNAKLLQECCDALVVDSAVGMNCRRCAAALALRERGGISFNSFGFGRCSRERLMPGGQIITPQFAGEPILPSAPRDADDARPRSAAALLAFAPRAYQCHQAGQRCCCMQALDIASGKLPRPRLYEEDCGGIETYGRRALIRNRGGSASMIFAGGM